MTDKETESKRQEGRGPGGLFDGSKPGPGRPPGVPNKATSQVRQLFADLVETNAGKAQELFDRVAKDNPDKALDLLIRMAEFVLPKLARTETTLETDPERPPALIIKRSR
jgi:hypothetical protein